MENHIYKIAIIGTESSGKTSVCQALAQHFKTVFVDEYARDYLNKLDRDYEEKDLLHIAKGQYLIEQQKISQANKYLFCDTDLANIQIWSEFKYGRCDLSLLNLVSTNQYDAFMLTTVNERWEADKLREYPQLDKRNELHQYYLEYALNENKPLLLLEQNFNIAFITKFIMNIENR